MPQMSDVGSSGTSEPSRNVELYLSHYVHKARPEGSKHWQTGGEKNNNCLVMFQYVFNIFSTFYFSPLEEHFTILHTLTIYNLELHNHKSTKS